MQKKRVIPTGFMTIGELAKKMGTTVRTLQYYDYEGVLSPTAQSEGGRRLYTDKDMIKLHQIQSFKSLGFSLDDIKNRMMPLDTPLEVENALTQQAITIREKIKQLSEELTAIEALKEEVAQMQVVDFQKYADIIINLHMDNEYYWLVKYFDDDTLDYFHKRFDKESGMHFLKNFKQVRDEVIKFQKSGISFEDHRAQALAKKFWNMIIDITSGDMSMLSKLMEFGNMIDGGNDWIKYLKALLEHYFQGSGINPFEEV